MAQILHWLEYHLALTSGLILAWIVTVVVTVWAARRFLITIPADHFTRPHQPLERWRNSHPALRWSLLIAKNLLGISLAVAGVIMLFTPGQGILTLLLGISLVDFPGKRACERWLVERPAVLHLVNHMRAKADRPPLVF